jgi:hypothetical protein
MKVGKTVSDPFDHLRPLAAPLYLIALFLVVVPTVDLAMNFLPAAFGEVGWRYGAVGMLSGFVLTPLLGFTLATVVAHTLEQRMAMSIVAVLNLLVALILISLTIMFVLDVLQLRSVQTPQQVHLFDLGAAKAIGKNLGTAVVLLLLGVGGFRSRAGIRAAPRDFTPTVVVPPELQELQPGQIAPDVVARARAIVDRAGAFPEPTAAPSSRDREVRGTVVTGAITTESMPTDLTSDRDDLYRGWNVVWISGELTGTVAEVKTYDGETKILGFSKVAFGPAAGDRFVLKPAGDSARPAASGAGAVPPGGESHREPAVGGETGRPEADGESERPGDPD